MRKIFIPNEQHHASLEAPSCHEKKPNLVVGDSVKHGVDLAQLLHVTVIQGMGTEPGVLLES